MTTQRGPTLNYDKICKLKRNPLTQNLKKRERVTDWSTEHFKIS